MVTAEGLEPSTDCLEGSCSIQLSYAVILIKNLFSTLVFLFPYIKFINKLFFNQFIYKFYQRDEIATFRIAVYYVQISPVVHIIRLLR